MLHDHKSHGLLFCIKKRVKQRSKMTSHSVKVRNTKRLSEQLSQENY